MTKFVYKIQRNSDGLFSSGGSYPRFSEKGKTWNSRGAVTSHLSMVSDREKQRLYADCSVVAYQIVEEEHDAVKVQDWKPAHSTVRAKELQEQRQLELERERKQREIAELEKKLKRMRGY